MDNLTYEIFIRRCWECGRGKHGADTDTWEDLLIKKHIAENTTPASNQASHQYQRKLELVKGHLDKAFNKLITKAHRKNVSPPTLVILKDRQTKVEASTEPQEIWDILRSVFPIMNDNSL